MRTEHRFGGRLPLLVAHAALGISAFLAGCERVGSSQGKGQDTLPQLIASQNFDDLSVPFTVTKDTVVNINAYGEGMDYSINKEVIRSYDNDCVEVFFDLKNDKAPSFDATGDDRQYRIVWKLLRIDGINFNSKDVMLAESDPDDKSYVMEIAFPWKTLGYAVPAVNEKIGFDVAIDDNDKETRKGMLAWNSTVDDAWKNTSIYGTLSLSASKSGAAEHHALSLLATTPLAIDGVAESAWDDVPKYQFTRIMTGYVNDKDDLSGYYRSMWDKDNFYLLVNVHDNVKNYAQAMFDYGWIENK
jgi:hypothetical protein